MKKAILLLFIILFSSRLLFSNEVNYFKYHELINKAENFYFLTSLYDSASYYYKKAFLDFDFVFAKDCLIASEISILQNNHLDFMVFIKKGFENGIKIEDLSTIEYLDKEYTNRRVEIFDVVIRQHKVELTKMYTIARQIYLSRINKNIGIPISLPKPINHDSLI